MRVSILSGKARERGTIVPSVPYPARQVPDTVRMESTHMMEGIWRERRITMR
jgi:hypothetical protein